MDTMQAFYSQLFSTETEQDTYLQALEELTRMSPAEIASLEFEGAWELWA